MKAILTGKRWNLVVILFGFPWWLVNLDTFSCVCQPLILHPLNHAPSLSFTRFLAGAFVWLWSFWSSWPIIDVNPVSVAQAAFPPVMSVASSLCWVFPLLCSYSIFFTALGEENSFPPGRKLILSAEVGYGCGLISGGSSVFHWSPCLFLRQHQPALFSTALEYVLKSSITLLPALKS